MDALWNPTGSNTVDVVMEDSVGTKPGFGIKPMGPESKRVAVHEEMKRVNKLPPNSSYATHRRRVLNKILQLLSIQRTTSQDVELELLFSGLSL